MGFWVSSQGEARQDEARRGMAWYGSLWQGEAEHNNARQDKAMQVKARQCNRFGVYCASGGPVIILKYFLARIGALGQFHSGFVDASGLKIAFNLVLTLPDDMGCPGLSISCGIIDL